MRVRAQDKKIVKYLAVMAAIYCASIAVLTVLDKSDMAKQDFQQQKSYIDRHIILLSVENSINSSNTEVPPGGMLGEAKLELADKKLKLERMKTGFWIALPAWAFVAVCVGTGLAAAVGGFCVSWAFFWTTILTMIMMTRGICRIFRRRPSGQKSPNVAANNPRTGGRERRKAV